jgi:phenylalanyl-tRNA synthetase alpha subunit
MKCNDKYRFNPDRFPFPPLENGMEIEVWNDEKTEWRPSVVVALLESTETK